MKCLDNNYCENAKVSDDSKYDEKDILWHDGIWHSGSWLGGRWWGGYWQNGTWHFGEWHDGIWHGGIWQNGTWFNNTFCYWINGKWENGNIVIIYGNVKTIYISPKSFNKPKNTLSLNYAKYSKNT